MRRASHFRSALQSLPLAVPAVRRARRIRRDMRTWYLRRRYPVGGFLRCNDVEVFCNFGDDSYAWYDGDSPHLAFDQELIVSLLRQTPGNVLLDIGAHFGFFSAFLAGLTTTGSGLGWKVMALEPDRSHFDCLTRTLERCPTRAHVTPLQEAIADRDGTVCLFRTSATCLHSYHEEDAQAMYEVSARSLDSLVAAYLKPPDRLALIKIDVDGAEPMLFAGGEQTLRAHRPVIVMEFAPSHLEAAGFNPKTVFDSLCARYNVYWVLHARRSLRRIHQEEYPELREATTAAVSDLVLSSTDVHLDALCGSQGAGR